MRVMCVRTLNTAHDTKQYFLITQNETKREINISPLCSLRVIYTMGRMAIIRAQRISRIGHESQQRGNRRGISLWRVKTKTKINAQNNNEIAQNETHNEIALSIGSIERYVRSAMRCVHTTLAENYQKRKKEREEINRRISRQ